MRTALLLLLALAGPTACSSAATTPAGAISPQAPSTVPPPGGASTAPAVAADGKHFVAEVEYLGECMPGGSRGGCYRFAFSPDGHARHLLLDAWDEGTYRIEGNTIIYRSGNPGAEDDRLESTDGFRTLSGGYRLTP